MNLKEIHEPLLLKRGFIPTCCDKFNPMGTCYKLDPSLGKGHYWIYFYKDLFSIVIHDFYFYKDFYLESWLPEYFSISYFESVSGEELNPYHRLNTGCIKSYWFASKKYQAVFHKNIPIKAIGIEFTPKYFDDYLVQKYGKNDVNPRAALLNINETTHFPEMILLMHQLRTYKEVGMAAQLFYEGKVAEAVSLVINAQSIRKKQPCPPISQIDREHITNVVSFINDHYAFHLKLNQLAKIACMGTTKLKTTFKNIHKCSITQYIQNRRMSQAEHLLINTCFDIKQIALIVGYKSASRFSELFKRSTGLTPKEYRKQSKGL